MSDIVAPRFKVEWRQSWLGILVGEPSLENPLESCIEEWECVVAFYEEFPKKLLALDWGEHSTCAFCVLYYETAYPYYCLGCPIEAMRHQFCHGTPYDAYADAVINNCDPIAARLAAEQELAFLIDMRGGQVQ